MWDRVVHMQDSELLSSAVCERYMHVSNVSETNFSGLHPERHLSHSLVMSSAAWCGFTLTYLQTYNQQLNKQLRKYESFGSVTWMQALSQLVATAFKEAVVCPA